MTRQKSIKRKVRERMSETGERYASARAAILGTDAPGAGAVAVARHPETWALSRLLAHAGLDSSESFALGVAGGAGFLGMAFRYEEEDFTNLHVSGWNPFQSSIAAVAQRLRMLGTPHETTGARAAATALDAALANGAPGAVWVDAATLGLAPAALAGMSPAVLVVRRRPDGVLAASDGSGPEVAIEPEQLKAARARIRSQRHRLLTISGEPGDLCSAARAGLDATAAGALGGPQANSGPAGIAALARRMTARSGRDAWTVVFAGDKHLWGALIGLHTLVRREDGLLRRAQAAFERAAAELLELPQLEDCARRHEELGARWLELADAALPADVPAFARARAEVAGGGAAQAARGEPFPLAEAERMELLGGLARRLVTIAAAEEEVLAQLGRALG